MIRLLYQSFSPLIRFSPYPLYFCILLTPKHATRQQFFLHSTHHSLFTFFVSRITTHDSRFYVCWQIGKGANLVLFGGAV